MRKIFIILTLILTKNIVYCIYVSEYSFVGYPQESGVVFLNPAGTGNLSRFNLDISYGMMFKNVINENLYNTELSLSYLLKNPLFFGLGYRELVLEDIYSESLLLLNFGVKLFNKKLIVGTNFKYFLFKYFYDEYYINDILAENNLQINNLDFGFLWKIKNDIFLSCSLINFIDSFLGKEIKYSLPQVYIIGLGYGYGPTIVNFEYHIIKNVVNQKNLNNSELKICLKQEMFYSDKIILNLIAELNKTKSFDNFVLGTEIRFFSHNFGLKYFWVYPIGFASEITGFSGNHYINFNLYFGKKIVKKIIEHPKPEEIVIIKKVKPKKKKIIVEQKEELPRPITELQKVEISSSAVSSVIEEKKQVEPEVLISTKQIITEKVLPKRLEEVESSKIEKIEVKEPSLKREVLISTKPIVIEIIKKEIQPQQTKETYKFPLAHKVLKGETLISISKKYYNNEKGWKKIYEANKNKIIKGIPIVGEILIIPEP